MGVQGREVTSSCDVRVGSRREVSQIINKAQLGDGEMEKGERLCWQQLCPRSLQTLGSGLKRLHV